MKTNLALVISLVLGMAFCSGCASTSIKGLSALQGIWIGHEVDGPTGECRMTISGDSLKFQGARQEEWYGARLILNPSIDPKQAEVLIEDCSAPQYIRKTAKGIYKFEGRTLTIAANEPGDEARPTGFERNATSRARVFVFERQ